MEARSLLAGALLIAGAACVGGGAASAIYAEYAQRAAHESWLAAAPAAISEHADNGSASERENARVPHPLIPCRGGLCPPDRHLPSGVVGRMTFERQGREIYVFGDEDPSNLKRGPVWLRMTKPFGSQGNTVVAGHRDTHFRFLKDAQVGDRFLVETDSTREEYRITQIRVVNPAERSLLAPSKKQVLTLVTCYPFHLLGRATRRMIIRAEVVSLITAPVAIN